MAASEGGSGLTDWVTAASTAITALLVGFSGWVAWLAYLRDKRRDLPVIEPGFLWEDGGELGRYLGLQLLVTNRLDETLLVESASVLRPRGTLLSAGKRVQTGYSGGDLAATPGSSDSVTLSETIRPVGSTSELMAGQRERTDAAEIFLYIFPPPKWLSGEMRIVLRISSKALTIRDRRMVIKSKIPAEPVKKTEEATSKTG